MSGEDLIIDSLLGDDVPRAKRLEAADAVRDLRARLAAAVHEIGYRCPHCASERWGRPWVDGEPDFTRRMCNDCLRVYPCTDEAP